ncbi:MAG: dihydrolipoyl dehydrogenase [Alphaproteobacteria bacterium]|nr:dihydrolipoyl dehydrogenase [Alphaproteobacteria bacterium]
MTTSDLIIIGGGPGGYVTAIRASQLGMKVTLIEREHLGGICLNWGCIPTKALLKSAEVVTTIKHAGAYGITVKDFSFDLKKIVERSRAVSSQLSAGVKHLMNKNKVEVIEGTGKLLGKGKVEVTDKSGKKIAELAAKHIIVATGARPRILPGLEPDGKLVWTYKEAMVPETLPKSLLVVGSGAIGIEFASFYNALGSNVTVVEVMDRVMPVEDVEISAFAHKALEKRGLKIITKAIVKRLDKTKDRVTATIEKEGKSTQASFDRVIMAVGIVANIENIGLENTKAVIEKGHIKVDEWSSTAEPGLYAIGDVTAPPWLAHKASHEGTICVEKIAGVKDVHPLDLGNIPGCTYCTPQVASVGMTEAKAKSAGYDVRVGRFSFLGNGKAIAMGEPEGMIKTVFDAKTGELLGAHMVGSEVTEMIQGFTVGRALETTEAELMHTVFPHPTISESMHEAVLDAYGRVVHM